MSGSLEWEVLGSRPGPDYRIFKVRWDRLRNPRTGEEFEPVLLEANDWVTVLALTEQDEVVFVRQYRFGIGEVTIEIPAGLGDEAETPLEAAQRELREETGHAAASWEKLGTTHGNPAFLTNRCHHFLARGAYPVQAADAFREEGEDTACEVLPLSEARRLAREGVIQHSDTLAALSRIISLAD